MKFFDLNANGRRDAGEPGIPRFLVWADYDNDGRRDATEPFTETDDNGRYVLDDIRPPGGSYRLRESLLTRRNATATSWVCSFPHAGTPGGFGNGPGGLFGCGWGPIASATTPHAQDRDFGNWLPARLTVEKQLWPAGDPGRFDLNVNGADGPAGRRRRGDHHDRRAARLLRHHRSRRAAHQRQRLPLERDLPADHAAPRTLALR